MKRRLVLGGVFFVLLIAGILVLRTGRQRGNYATKMEYSLKSQTRIQVPLKRDVSLEKREESEPKSDQPDEFMRLQREIRTRYGKSGPEYPANYKMLELNKAVARRYGVSLDKLGPRLSLNSTAALPWQERGPGNVSGRTRGLIVDPDDPSANTWFAGSVGGGIWKTTDGGATWTNKTPSLPNLGTTSLAMASSNRNIIYAGTGEGFFNADAVNGDGIFKSTDHGETWTQLSSTASNASFQNVNRIIVDPSNENTLLACANPGFYSRSSMSGIFRSTDGGSGWLQVYNSGSSRVQQIVANPLNFKTLYATVNKSGVIKSIDGGLSWNPTSGITTTGRVEMAVARTDTAWLYAGVESRTGSDLYVSTDAGQTWLQANDTAGTNVNWLGVQGWYDNTIAVHPYARDTLFVGGISIHKIYLRPGTTTVNPTKITGPPLPYVHVDQHNLVMIPINQATNSFRILNANDGGASISSDGGKSWTQIVTYPTTQFYGADKKPGASVYIGGTQDNGTWVSGNNPGPTSPYTRVLGGDGFEGSWHYDNPLLMIGSIQYNAIRKSTDGGIAWDVATSGLTDVGSSMGPFITKIAKTNSDPDLIFAVGASGVWRSDDFANSWILSPIPPATLAFSSSFTEVQVSQSNPRYVWAGAHMDASGKISVSKDGGLTFSPTNNYAGATLGRVSGMATHPTQDSTAFVLFSIAQGPKIIRTTDLGQTWTDISGFGSGTVSTNGFPDVATYCLLVNPRQTNKLWAGTEIGLFESTDEGGSWALAANGFPNVAIWDMKVVDYQVVVATHGRGIWSVTLPELAGYTPPVAILSPRLNPLAQSPDGALAVHVSLRSAYDSAQVIINGTPSLTVVNTAAKDTTLRLPVTVARRDTVTVTAFKSGLVYKSSTRTIDVKVYSAPQPSYANNFNTATTDFVGTDFSVTTPGNFANGAIHSSHPYSNNSNNTYQLLIPIVVASLNATLKYDDIAIVEPGDSGSVFGNLNFYDYAIVEGTVDGLNWVRLLDGYDCRYDAAWLAAWRASGSGDSTMFRSHSIDLLSEFTTGQSILIRFRLFADGSANGWGWAIDNLAIQTASTSVSAGPAIPKSFSLEQNYPNPFNPSTTIRYDLPVQSRVLLRVYDLLGREVRTLVDGAESAGSKSIQWDGKNGSGTQVATGMYIYKLEAGTFTRTLKMLLLK